MGVYCIHTNDVYESINSYSCNIYDMSQELYSKYVPFDAP